ncbi:O-antigen ligase family protein [Paenibacillus tyrfis]|uniref:O-antigen ligase family protein n=1 Tax=Paenibacillus tyrfis TaxID=1501230 RepID=UPI0020A1A644|nr:O-antigen ligase family protein [Paenibacillus tyrfis]MCP1310272.1 O-antigen ligase family protein [Paenibacillus tyrfis]
MNTPYVSRKQWLESREQEKGSLLFYLVLGFVLLFLFIAPFHQGLFLMFSYEAKPGNNIFYNFPLYSSYIFVYIALFLTSLFLMTSFKATGKRDMLLLLAVWLIPLAYLIPVLTRPASMYLALQGLYAELMYAAFFVISWVLARNKKGAALVQYGILYSGYALVIYGLLVWYGNIQAHGVIIADSNGMRLTSSFTYANSYAAYLIAIILGALYMIASSSKWAAAAGNALILAPALLSLILTLSRGGLVLLPVVLLALLPFIRLSGQIVMILNLGIAAAAAFILSGPSTRIGAELFKTSNAALSAQAWLQLAAGSMVVALLSAVIHKYVPPAVRKLEEKFKLRYARLWFPLVILLVGGIGIAVVLNSQWVLNLLPENLQQRIASINFQQHSVQERGYFYKDAMQIVNEAPLFGKGGGAWAALYQSHQSYGYASNQAHNFLFQTLTDIGWGGALLLFTFIGCIVYFYVRHVIQHHETEDGRRHFVYFIVLVAILAHSFMDFDLSYGYLSALVFIGLGGLLAGAALPGTKDQELPITSGKAKWIYPGFVLLLSLCMLVVSIRLLKANTEAGKAYNELSQESVQLEKFVGFIDNAMELHSTNADYALLKIRILNDVYNQTKDKQYLQEAQQLAARYMDNEPYAHGIHENRYQWAVQDNAQQALAIASESISKYPWDMMWYERAMVLTYELGYAAGEGKKPAERDAYYQKAVGIYQHVQEKRESLKSIPSSISVPPFEISKPMLLVLGRISYDQGKYAEAADILRPALSDNLDSSVQRYIARWYVAALQKQGKTDQAWVDKLVAKDPNEAEELKKLAGA